MSETRSLSVNAAFEILNGTLLPAWPVRVTLRFSEDVVLRATPLGARVGAQQLERLTKVPKRSVLVGYLRREPRRGEELILRDGASERPTGIRYREESARVASLDARQKAPAAGCTLHDASLTCGACTATERRVRGVVGHLVEVPDAHVHERAAHHQLTDEACAAFVRMREAAITAGVIQASDEFLKLVSGYRSYATQTGIWKRRLQAVFASFGCSNWTKIAPVVDRTNQALAGAPVNTEHEAWGIRFRSDLTAAGIQPEGCDPTRMRAAAAEENEPVPTTAEIDVIDLVLRIGRKTVAPPGTSAHETGRAIDLFLGHAPNSGALNSNRHNVAWQREQPWFLWLVCNAAQYGYFPYQREPWHWEYNPR